MLFWPIGIPLGHYSANLSFYAQFDPKEVELEYILYTDCDVLFEKAIDTCTVPPMPPILYVGGEAFQDSIENTGEMDMAMR